VCLPPQEKVGGRWAVGEEWGERVGGLGLKKVEVSFSVRDVARGEELAWWVLYPSEKRTVVNLKEGESSRLG